MVGRWACQCRQSPQFHAATTENNPTTSGSYRIRYPQIPYDELTERIHQFHKKSQEIYKQFEYIDRQELLLSVKIKLRSTIEAGCT